MNTYEFEYDTLSRMNQKCVYQAASLTEALARFKHNHAKTHIGKLLTLKENGKNIMDVIFSIFSDMTL